MVSLRRALLILIVGALLAVIVPTGVVLDRRLTRELESRARRELAVAPRVLADRSAVLNVALRMHAEKVALLPGLAAAMYRSDRAAALRTLDAARSSFEGEPVVVDARGTVWTGPPIRPDLVEGTQRGETLGGVVSDSAVSWMVALAPVERAGTRVGAAGVALALDSVIAGTLAGLSRSSVILLGEAGTVSTTMMPDRMAATIIATVRDWRPDGRVRTVLVNGRRYLVTKAPLGDRASAIFVRSLNDELGVLPKLRQAIVLSGGAVLLLGLLLGSLLAVLLARPVRSLATAAEQIAGGDFTAPVEPSSIREFRRLGHAFDVMRRALAVRLEELGNANRELAERQARLTTLQWELLQRERLAASGRLVTQLAHEIRNPVASVRNCLELVHRRLKDDPEGREFTEMAIHELLRMHELAERMLDLNRPRPAGPLHSDAVAVAREVAGLIQVGVSPGDLTVVVAGDREAKATIAPDPLKQVLLNLAQNAREATPHGLHLTITVRREPSIVSVEVLDNGPGIAPDVLPQVFDPFFTTKGTVGGVGLGLFVAEVIIRAHGGQITARNDANTGSACFRIELVAAEPGSAGDPGGTDTSEKLEHE